MTYQEEESTKNVVSVMAIVITLLICGLCYLLIQNESSRVQHQIETYRLERHYDSLISVQQTNLMQKQFTLNVMYMSYFKAFPIPVQGLLKSSISNNQKDFVYYQRLLSDSTITK